MRLSYFLACSFSVLYLCRGTGINDTYLRHLYNRLFNDWESNYDKKLRPNVGQEPVDIEVSVFVSSLRSVSEVSMSYEVDIYFREQWYDSRLDYGLEIFNNKSKITLHEDLANLLWIPDTFLPNSLEIGCKKSSDSVTHKKLLFLKPHGYLFQSRRFSLLTECPMDLMFYPFDRQICRLSIESYGHDIEDIIYHWHKTKSVIINPELELPEFKLANYVPKQRIINLYTGRYSRLELCFYFERRPGYFITALFFPATGIVAISWISLCLGKDSTVSDMIQIILAVIFLNFTQNTVMPKVSYVKAIDVYMGACLFFVFLSLIKLSFTKYSTQGDDVRSPTSESNNVIGLDQKHEGPTTVPLLATKGVDCNRNKHLNLCLYVGDIICKISAYLLPLLFTSFCLFYFIGYYWLGKRMLMDFSKLPTD